MTKKQKRNLVVFAGIIILASIILWYYYPRLTGFINQPARVFQLITLATGLGKISLNAVAVNLALLFTGLLIECLGLGWKSSALRRLTITRSGSAISDLWCWLLNLISLYDFFLFLLSLGLFYMLSGVIVKTGGAHILEYLTNPALQFLVIILLSDLKGYLWHRFMHFLPFWKLHQYHHSASEFNLLTSYRVHFFEKGILTLFDAVLFSLLGAPPDFFIYYYLFTEFYNQLLHSNLNWSLGWFGRYIFISPRAHKIHHSDETKFYNKNFGSLFNFWDRIFGTFSNTDEKITIGLKENPFNIKGFVWDILESIRQFGISVLRAEK